MLTYMLGMEQASAGDDASAAHTFRELADRDAYVPAFHMAGQALVRLDRVPEACDILRLGIAAAKAAGDSHALGEMQVLLESLE